MSSVIWATGFVPDWSWVQLDVFDERGHPEHLRGITTVDGLAVLGLPWLHTWGSGRFAGIAQDAAHVVEHIAARMGRRRGGGGGGSGSAASCVTRPAFSPDTTCFAGLSRRFRT